MLFLTIDINYNVKRFTICTKSAIIISHKTLLNQAKSSQETLPLTAFVNKNMQKLIIHTTNIFMHFLLFIKLIAIKYMRIFPDHRISNVYTVCLQKLLLSYHIIFKIIKFNIFLLCLSLVVTQHYATSNCNDRHVIVLHFVLSVYLHIYDNIRRISAWCQPPLRSAAIVRGRHFQQ